MLGYHLFNGGATVEQFKKANLCIGTHCHQEALLQYGQMPLYNDSFVTLISFIVSAPGSPMAKV